MTIFSTMANMRSMRYIKYGHYCEPPFLTLNIWIQKIYTGVLISP